MHLRKIQNIKNEYQKNTQRIPNFIYPANENCLKAPEQIIAIWIGWFIVFTGYFGQISVSSAAEHPKHCCQ